MLMTATKSSTTKIANLSRNKIRNLPDTFFNRVRPSCAAITSVSEAIVMAHGGTISVVSGVGEGTTMTLVFPAMPSDSEA